MASEQSKKRDAQQMMVDTLPEVPGGWNEQEFQLGEHCLRMVLPADPDAFLDDPAVHAEHERDGFFPWWAYLWPSSPQLAEYILRQNWKTRPETVELGAGLGLAGMAALACGLPVTFSDYRQLPIDLAMSNARRNGWTSVRGQLIDWRNPPAAAFELALGNDVLYESENLPLLLNTLETVLCPGGEAWFGEPGRRQAEPFPQLAAERGWRVEVRDAAGQLLPGIENGQFQVIRLQRETAG
ncbi:MAG: hypothetical protein KDA79_14370 [Planctomycetaceae bacterium]|nr:hypothetical protein [Planctomycetaceae bacterium]